MFTTTIPYAEVAQLVIRAKAELANRQRIVRQLEGKSIELIGLQGMQACLYYVIQDIKSGHYSIAINNLESAISLLFLPEYGVAKELLRDALGVLKNS